MDTISNSEVLEWAKQFLGKAESELTPWEILSLSVCHMGILWV